MKNSIICAKIIFHMFSDFDPLSAYYSSYQGDRYYGDGFPKDDGQVTQQYEDYPDLNGFLSLHYGLWRVSLLYY